MTSNTPPSTGTSESPAESATPPAPQTLTAEELVSLATAHTLTVIRNAVANAITSAFDEALADLEADDEAPD